jgi:hypothetical protein
METYRQYVTRRARTLKADYPDSTSQERREVLKQCQQEWLRTIAALPRSAVVPLAVGRSLVRLLSHSEASRMLRHVSNFPACLPVDRPAAPEVASPGYASSETCYGRTVGYGFAVKVF